MCLSIICPLEHCVFGCFYVYAFGGLGYIYACLRLSWLCALVISCLHGWCGKWLVIFCLWVSVRVCEFVHVCFCLYTNVCRCSVFCVFVFSIEYVLLCVFVSLASFTCSAVVIVQSISCPFVDCVWPFVCICVSRDSYC